MKKILLVLCLFILCACGDKYYTITIGEEVVTVGKDEKEVITNDNISYKTYINKKEKEIVSEIKFLVEDVNANIKIDDYELNKGVKDTCVDLDGEYSYTLNEVCLISKEVNNRENYIIIRGNILNDDVDKIDNITIGYDY